MWDNVQSALHGGKSLGFFLRDTLEKVNGFDQAKQTFIDAKFIAPVVSIILPLCWLIVLLNFGESSCPSVSLCFIVFVSVSFGFLARIDFPHTHPCCQPPLLSQYIIMAGDQPGQGAIITRDRNTTRDVWNLADAGQFWILETNYGR